MEGLLFTSYYFMYLITGPCNTPEKGRRVITILQMQELRPERLRNFPKVTSKQKCCSDVGPFTQTHTGTWEWLLLAAGMILGLDGLFLSWQRAVGARVVKQKPGRWLAH